MEHSLKQDFFQLINDCLNHSPTIGMNLTVTHSKRSLTSHSFPGGFPKKFRDFQSRGALHVTSSGSPGSPGSHGAFPVRKLLVYRRLLQNLASTI